MTRLLQEAIERAQQLPDERQDCLARLLIDEIEASREWDRRFEETAGRLEDLARSATERDDRGETVAKGWDEL